MSHLVHRVRPAGLTLLCACLLSAGARAAAQQPAPPPSLQLVSADTLRGVELYKQGNFKEASTLLKKASKRQSTDATAWEYLGLALKAQGDEKGARKALDKAIDLRFRQLAGAFNFDREFNELSKAERAVVRAEQAERERAALVAVKSYLQLSPKDADFWREQAETLLSYIALAESPDDQQDIYSASETTTKAVVTYNREPMFTQEARTNNTTGEVILRLVLAADGTVQHILVLKPLRHGLTQMSVAAARGMRFTPATKDGRPVSQFATVVYNFNIY